MCAISGAGRFAAATDLAGAHETIDDGPVLLFDAEGKGRADLLVTKGGNALPAGSPEYQPRLYFNDGQGGFRPAPEGALPPLPASYAMIPSDVVETFPHYGGKGCAAIGVTPEDVRQGIPNVIPDGFNSLPATLPAYN